MPLLPLPSAAPFLKPGVFGQVKEEEEKIKKANRYFSFWSQREREGNPMFKEIYILTTEITLFRINRSY